MAPRMAASVLRSLVLFVFLFICLVFCSPFLVTFTRGWSNFFRGFSHSSSSSLWDLPMWEALVRRRQQGLWTALLSIHLANVRSLANKMDELLLLSRTNTDFYRSAALCFTETWLGEHILDSSLHLPGFQLLHGDLMELSGKMRRGGICFYTNEDWYTDVTVLKKSCSPQLETLFINCKPFIVGVFLVHSGQCLHPSSGLC